MSVSKGSDAKRRVIVDYKNVTNEILDLFTDRYPYGYDDGDIIRFKNAKGEMVKAVPFETADTKYLVKVSVQMDQQIEAFLEDDDDDNDDVGENDGTADMDDVESDDLDD
ncbi:hypothetical protein [Croceimicrobium hydrocarbonivorans]|uniref:Uncharacterized protein n=1 Tax=Croceimicrobium hydrocarbonivorans TaxID=2761580 RepID=A0A7H0VJK5_9FLAO|nr:hypothetical protein [Croceimicrobium hydrocarbonivorans]QNR25903.1 hypothetical protein H4K34_08680 [Croceimicrobium hydrocarbonivorans]